LFSHPPHYCLTFKLYLFYNDYETSYTTNINLLQEPHEFKAQQHGLFADGIRERMAIPSVS